MAFQNAALSPVPICLSLQEHPVGGPQEARRALQQLLELEMAREGEREALLQACAGDDERARLQAFFALERQSAIALVHQLKQQLH
mgnify:CR=1 FL=1